MSSVSVGRYCCCTIHEAQTKFIFPLSLYLYVRRCKYMRCEVWKWWLWGLPFWEMWRLLVWQKNADISGERATCIFREQENLSVRPSKKTFCGLHVLQISYLRQCPLCEVHLNVFFDMLQALQRQVCHFCHHLWLC